MQDGPAQVSAPLALLTCPTCHAIIFAVIEGDIDVGSARDRQSEERTRYADSCSTERRED